MSGTPGCWSCVLLVSGGQRGCSLVCPAPARFVRPSRIAYSHLGPDPIVLFAAPGGSSADMLLLLLPRVGVCVPGFASPAWAVARRCRSLLLVSPPLPLLSGWRPPRVSALHIAISGALPATTGSPPGSKSLLLAGACRPPPPSSGASRMDVLPLLARPPFFPRCAGFSVKICRKICAPLSPLDRAPCYTCPWGGAFAPTTS